jgi:hypothetical protein
MEVASPLSRLFKILECLIIVGAYHDLVLRNRYSSSSLYSCHHCRLRADTMISKTTMSRFQFISGLPQSFCRRSGVGGEPKRSVNSEYVRGQLVPMIVIDWQKDLHEEGHG